MRPLDHDSNPPKNERGLYYVCEPVKPYTPYDEKPSAPTGATIGMVLCAFCGFLIGAAVAFVVFH